MSIFELQETVLENAKSIAEPRASTSELRASQEETYRQVQEDHAETRRQMRVTDLKIKEIGKQIGGLGNKFGTFAEGLVYGSIKKFLVRDFKLNEFVSPGVVMRKGGRVEEYDVLAYSNGNTDRGMIVEIKSKLRQADIDQMKRKMDEVFYWLPEHKNKTFFGMITYVTGSSELKRQIIENGWYLARVGDEIFEMETPEDFKPQSYRDEE